MIARMDGVLVVGPKAMMREVVEEVQAQGAVHITEVKEGERLVVSEARGSTLEEKLLSRVEGVLNLLPGKSEASPIAGEETPESWEAYVQDRETKARALTKQRVELEDERGIVEAYAEAVRILAPLLAPLETSRNFEAIGFTLEKRKAQVLELLRSEIMKLTEGRALVFSQEVDPRTLGAVVAFRKSDREKIRSLFVKQGVNELRLPSSVSGMPVADAVRTLEGRRRDLPGEIARVLADLEKLSLDAKPRLLGIALELRDRLARNEVLKSFGETRKTFILKGFVPSKSSPGLKDRLRTRFGESLIVQASPYRLSHGQDREEPPILLHNHPLVRPFELFIKILQPPRYGTIDPTPYFALFFPIFFGLIMGDIAYGLIILGFGLWMLLRFKRQVMFPQIGTVMIICGIYTMLFGFLFGEFFGDFFERLGWLHPLTLLGIEWNRMTALIPLLVVAVSIGVAHVMLGFVLNFVIALRMKHVHEIIEVPAILLALVGLFTLIAALAKAFPAPAMPGAIVVLVITVPVLLYLKGPLIVIELLSFVGNMLSYARLMAVGVASVYLAFVANMFAGMVGNIVIGVILAALIHAINLALAFSPIIQSARLHYVEFFGKFYKSGGKDYKPFKRGGITP